MSKSDKYQFRSTFLLRSIFKSFYFLKWCPIFDTSPLTWFSKFNNVLWVCWFLDKNLSNFVPPFENSTTRIAITYTLGIIFEKNVIHSALSALLICPFFLLSTIWYSVLPMTKVLSSNVAKTEIKIKNAR